MEWKRDRSILGRFLLIHSFSNTYPSCILGINPISSYMLICFQVNMIGVHFEDNHVATGFGNHLARPLLHEEWHENLSFEDDVKLEIYMRILLYRDRSAVNKLQVWYFINSHHIYTNFLFLRLHKWIVLMKFGKDVLKIISIVLFINKRLSRGGCSGKSMF